MLKVDALYLHKCNYFDEKLKLKNTVYQNINYQQKFRFVPYVLAFEQLVKVSCSKKMCCLPEKN